LAVANGLLNDCDDQVAMVAAASPFTFDEDRT
jgi:hypothetical protein